MHATVVTRLVRVIQYTPAGVYWVARSMRANARLAGR